MKKYGAKKIIFSSSCSVYGIPHYTPIDEKHPIAPVNAYGKTKIAVEHVLQDYAMAYGINFVALRYFNAAGSLHEKMLGEGQNSCR